MNMNHDEIVAKAELLGLEVEDQDDEKLLAAITEAEEEDAAAAVKAKEEREAAEELAEKRRLEAEALEDRRIADEEAAVKVANKARATGARPPTKLYLVNSGFWFKDPRTGKDRKANNGANIRLTDTQAVKYLRNRNVELVA